MSRTWAAIASIRVLSLTLATLAAAATATDTRAGQACGEPPPPAAHPSPACLPAPLASCLVSGLSLSPVKRMQYHQEWGTGRERHVREALGGKIVGNRFHGLAY